MSRLLNDLAVDFQPLAFEFIARCTEAGIPLFIVFTGRTQQEQADLYAQGRTKPGPKVTWTLDSKHVIKPERPGAEAMDVVPYDQFQLFGPDKLNWDTETPAALAVWKKIGAIAVSLGLRWGATWAVAVEPISKSKPDWGHIEYVRP